MISDVLHFLRLLFELQRTGREPDRPLKQQCIHLRCSLQPDHVGDVLVGGGLFLVRALPFRQIPNFKTAAAAHERDLAFQPQLAAKVFRQDETALFVRCAVFGARMQLARKNPAVARRDAVIVFGMRRSCGQTPPAT